MRRRSPVRRIGTGAQRNESSEEEPMDHEVGVILFWVIGAPVVVAVVWMGISVFRRRDGGA